ncbi:MAG: aminopeptidase P family N-terminal domain-containing protein [Clostridia bacterium]|nr:aminopeptidase P family N-terminal domain-containing protein [Clostridia bacterium]
MNSKIRALRNQMTAKGLEGMIVSNPVNIRYLTGLTAERNTSFNTKRKYFYHRFKIYGSGQFIFNNRRRDCSI